MYRVILVDDELWTLKGIQETFKWNQYGFEVTGAYAFATRALEEILAQKPDVVFTDIRMPVLSGVELLNEIRRNGLDAEVIIISGFGQFDYAQEAIRQGAFDYLLKPVDEGETDALLERLKTKLDRKAEERNKRIIEMITEGENSSRPEDYGLHSRFPYYQAISAQGPDDTAMKTFLQQADDLEYIPIFMSDKIYYIINCSADLLAGIRQQDFPMTVGVSSLSEGSADIPELITQASVASASVFITDRADTYSYREMQSQKLIPYIIRITKILNEGKLVDFIQLIDEIPQMFREKKYSVEDLCFLWNRVMMSIELLAPSKFQHLTLEFCEWQQLEAKYESLTGMCHTLTEEVQYCFGHSEFEMEEDELRSSNFSNMLKYLNKNFNKQIKLKDVAQMFYVNKNYACYLFKRYTGMTYSEYLNKLRMEHAKEMLVTTSCTIAEVSEQSGYIDYFYFCKLFKKTYGLTPTQYRQKPVEMAD